MAGCVDFVPYQYTQDTADNYVHTASGWLFDIEFTLPTDGCQIWEYRAPADAWIVRINGGTLETGEEIEEPFIFADRGAWFDGKYDLMTFELLKYSLVDLNMNFWLKPHSDGVVYSSNRRVETNDSVDT
jgi:hypothetical protein